MTTAPTTRESSVLDLTQPMINIKSAHAANAEELEVGDVESEASSDTEPSDEEDPQGVPPTGTVSVTGSEPAFGPGHIVSERVSTFGKIRPFEPIDSIPALHPNLRDHIGQVHPDGAVKKWLAKRAEWDEKYRQDLIKWRTIKRTDRKLAEKSGFLTRDLIGERPPLASIAGTFDRDMAREMGKSVDEISKKTSAAMLIWYRMSTKVSSSPPGTIALLMVGGQRACRWGKHGRDQENGRGRNSGRRGEVGQAQL